MPDIFVQSESATLRPSVEKSSHVPPKSVVPPDELNDLGMTDEDEKKCRVIDDYSDVMKKERPTHNPFVAYAPKPQKVSFDSQNKNEVVILLLRRHPVTQVPWVVTALFMIILPIFIVGAFPFFALLPGMYQTAGLLGWYGLTFSFVLQSFLMWFFNVYIITDERVIDVDFTSLIYKNISSAKLDNIEDITATTGGAVRSVFDFGTIKIQTAAATTQFEFEDVPHPARITSLLNEMLIEEEREKLEGRVS